MFLALFPGIRFRATSLYAVRNNDLLNCSTFPTALFADETYVCLSDKNLNDLQFSVNFELQMKAFK